MFIDRKYEGNYWYSKRFHCNDTNWIERTSSKVSGKGMLILNLLLQKEIIL